MSPMSADVTELTSDTTTPEVAPDSPSPVRSVTSAIPSARGYQPRAANGRFVRVESADDLPADRFLEREISWLQFNERVLQLAMDEDVPLLERVKFLAIFSNNLDEFFMVRVAGLKRRIATGLAVRSASGLEPREVLEKISEVAQQLMGMQAALFLDHVRPALEAEASRSPTGATSARRSASRCTCSSPSRSSRCSPRSPSTRRTPSPTSPACRSTLR